MVEAMKMETQVVAPFSGKIRQVMAIPNVQVSTGDPLLQIEPCVVHRENASAAAERVSFDDSLSRLRDTQTAAFRRRQGLDDLRQLTLGFDVTPEQASRLVAELKQVEGTAADADEIRQTKMPF